MSVDKFIGQMKELVTRSEGKMVLITPLALDLLVEIAGAAHNYEQCLSEGDLRAIDTADAKLLSALRRTSAAQLDADTKLVVFPDV